MNTSDKISKAQEQQILGVAVNIPENTNKIEAFSVDDSVHKAYVRRYVEYFWFRHR